MRKHITIRVTGRVQGVWYRQSTYEEAVKLGLVGTVQNMPGGSVEIHAEGEEEKLQELLRWCEEGPEHARVDRVWHEENKAKGYDTFRII